MQIRSLFSAAAILSLGLVASAVHAQTVSLNFDDVLPGTVINNTYAAQGVTFAGVAPFFTDVQAIDTVSASAPNSLDATGSEVTVSLIGPFSGGATNFTIDLVPDPLGFGSPNTSIQFLDGLGNVVGSLDNIDQTVAQTLFFNSALFQKVVLPGDAYYDNLKVGVVSAAAPEPSTVALYATGALPLLGLVIRRRRNG